MDEQTARLIRFYGGGISLSEFYNMDLLTFFNYHEIALKLHREEKAEIEKQTKK